MPRIEIHPNVHSPNGNGVKRIEVVIRNGGGITDVTRIKGVSEQEMFIFLRHKFPDWEITYEPVEIWIHSQNGEKEGTIPDFGLRKPNDITITLLEITTSRNNGTDPKENQKRIMREAALPNVRFVVLYRENLKSIMSKHREVKFFRVKRITKPRNLGKNLVK